MEPRSDLYLCVQWPWLTGDGSPHSQYTDPCISICIFSLSIYGLQWPGGTFLQKVVIFFLTLMTHHKHVFNPSNENFKQCIILYSHSKYIINHLCNTDCMCKMIILKAVSLNCFMFHIKHIIHKSVEWYKSIAIVQEITRPPW